VDTTVQPKAITFPTDGKLLYRAMVLLGKLARRCGIRLRQSYLRVGKLALMRSQRYAHWMKEGAHLSLNAILCGIGQNVHLLLRWFALLLCLFLAWLYEAVLSRQLNPA